ncbi:MAG TPA: hypothetical protein VFY68_10255 [Nitrososphaeraceae archaeon]|nr:hypothetical protein [Nitrososphaeraceae archaeon]
MRKITILAIVAILTGTSIFAATGFSSFTSAVAQTTDNATTASNMTGGNMTMGEQTNQTGSISSADRPF